jgi:single-stranded-DNA-specific exonuclease
LNDCSDLLESWGGHPSAVGVLVKSENIDALRTRFCNIVAAKTRNTVFDEIIEIADELNLDDIDDDFMHDLELLHPFGQGNPEPIFLLRSIKIGSMPELFGTARSHVKFWLNRQYAKRILVIGWGMADNIPPIGVDLELAVKINMDFWNGNKSKRLTLVDWHVSELYGHNKPLLQHIPAVSN